MRQMTADKRNRGLTAAFVQRQLPWIIAGATLLLYLITLNTWITVQSAPIVSKVTGWDWNRTLSMPVLYIVTFPFRFLPMSWQPVALNLFSAVCAALTLALLARSVALLPHDRTREQRQRERSDHSLLSIPTAWIPPILAVLACGLQLTFWEHATALTGEMLNLLLFAYIIRALLEYRLDEHEGWVRKIGFVYGIALTNNWAMIGFLPIFLIALVWIRGRRFFNLRFLGQLSGFAFLGLLLYLLIPLVEVTTTHTDATFLQLLRSELGAQKNFLLFGPLRNRALLLSLTSLVPLLMIGIRWPSTFGDTSAFGNAITTVMFRVIHGVFLAACLYVVFDPPFSPRQLGLGQSFLTFYYLGALAIGYFSGYFLLVFGTDPSRSWRRPTPAVRAFNRAVATIVGLAAIGIPAGLIAKNWSALAARNSDLVADFALRSAQKLPEERSIILSDDKLQLLLVKAAYSEHLEGPDHVFLNTGFLPHKFYQRTMAARYPDWWPTPDLDELEEPIPSQVLMGMIAELDEAHPVYYLQPSFGYYFEWFFEMPRGLVYELQPYAGDEVAPSSVTPETIRENETFWDQFDFSQGAPLLSALSRNVGDARTLGRYYSRALNHWGVILQRNDRLDDAGRYFELALRLNTDNVAAEVNRAFNDHLLDGNPKSVTWGQDVEAKVGEYRSWDQLLKECGPVDAPDFCFYLGRVFAGKGLHRQAARQFRRSVELDPEHLEAHLWLADIYLRNQMPDRVFEVTREIKDLRSLDEMSFENRVDLVQLEAWAHFGKEDFDKAETLLRDFYREHPQSPELLSTLAQMYLYSDNIENALTTLDEQLESNPDDIQALLLKSALHIHNEEPEKAVQPLERVLERDPENVAGLVNQGLAYLRLERYDAAKETYRSLLKSAPAMHSVHYQLAEICYRQEDEKEAIRHYRQFLESEPDGTDRKRQVLDRLAELQGEEYVAQDSPSPGERIRE